MLHPVTAGFKQLSRCLFFNFYSQKMHGTVGGFGRSFRNKTQKIRFLWGGAEKIISRTHRPLFWGAGPLFEIVYGAIFHLGNDFFDKMCQMHCPNLVMEWGKKRAHAMKTPLVFKFLMSPPIYRARVFKMRLVWLASERGQNMGDYK